MNVLDSPLISNSSGDALYWDSDQNIVPSQCWCAGLHGNGCCPSLLVSFGERSGCLSQSFFSGIEPKLLQWNCQPLPLLVRANELELSFLLVRLSISPRSQFFCGALHSFHHSVAESESLSLAWAISAPCSAPPPLSRGEMSPLVHVHWFCPRGCNWPSNYARTCGSLQNR
jgi:hypothetical protein